MCRYAILIVVSMFSFSLQAVDRSNPWEMMFHPTEIGHAMEEALDARDSDSSDNDTDVEDSGEEDSEDE